MSEADYTPLSNAVIEHQRATRQATLDEVRRLVELSRDKEFDEWGRGHDRAIDEVLAIIDAMKEESK